MSELHNFEYVSPIPPTETDARSIQALTLQDVITGGFNNPTDLANPNDPIKVNKQLDKLTQFPERYSAYKNENGVLVAYMKSNEWLTGDETPFIENVFARNALLLTSKVRGGSLRPKEYGVFGLVGSDSLESQERDDILYDLLRRSIGQATTKSAFAVNIVLHDHDPVTPVALDLGFRPSGAKGTAAGAPGLVQHRYRRSIE
jgi:hypothetical protein